MSNAFFSAVICIVSFAVAAAPAKAESIDASTIACEKINTAYTSQTATDMSFINGILNWMGGYHATEAQGTVVDWKKLSKAFDQTTAFCGEHPNVGVMSASARFMGDHIEEPGSDAYDLAILTCESLLTDKSVIKNAGDTLMWLAGYHTSTNKDSTTLDLDKFVSQTVQIADYCAANPKSGLVTASEKFMSEAE
jgi:hypothetical protein